MSCSDLLVSVHPEISATWETQHGKVVAVCRAERGKPVANISWSHEGKVEERWFQTADGFFTVESYLEPLNGTDTKNLTCAIRHPYWSEEQTLEPKPGKGQACKKMASFWVKRLVPVHFSSQNQFKCKCNQSRLLIKLLFVNWELPRKPSRACGFGPRHPPSSTRTLSRWLTFL